MGETGLDYFRDYAPRDAQQRSSLRELELALEVGKPVVIHTRAADDDTIARLVEHRRPRSSFTASHHRPAPPAALEHGVVRLLRRERDLQERLRPARLPAPRAG